MANTLEDLVTIAVAKVGQTEVNPCCVFVRKLGQQREVESMCGEPESMKEEDWYWDVVDAGFLRLLEVAIEAEIPIDGDVQDPGAKGEEEVGCHDVTNLGGESQRLNDSSTKTFPMPKSR